MHNTCHQNQRRDIAVLRSKVNVQKIAYLKDCSVTFMLDLYEALDRTVFAPEEKLNAPFTLFLIANYGVVLKNGHVFSRGAVLAQVELMDVRRVRLL